MAFNAAYNYMTALVKNDEEVPSDTPCRWEILAIRDCLKNQSDCTLNQLEITACQADLLVDIKEKEQIAMGVAKYNEHVKEMSDKYGKEKAQEIIDMPKNIQAVTHAKTLLWAVANGKHAKGTPKPDWTPADIVRHEMGEANYQDAAEVVIAEFGLEKADTILDILEEKKQVRAAAELLAPGSLKALKTEVSQESVKATYPSLKFDGTDGIDAVRAAIQKAQESL